MRDLSRSTNSRTVLSPFPTPEGEDLASFFRHGCLKALVARVKLAADHPVRVLPRSQHVIYIAAAAANPAKLTSPDVLPVATPYRAAGRSVQVGTPPARFAAALSMFRSSPVQLPATAWTRLTIAQKKIDTTILSTPNKLDSPYRPSHNDPGQTAALSVP